MLSHGEQSLTVLDPYLSSLVRQRIEQNFYDPINQQAAFSEALKEPSFHQHPLQHRSFFTDNGTVHVRDIALRMLTLLEQLNGVHFPQRANARLEFMKGYGVMLAYLHDIGVSQNTLDHSLHAQISAQLLYGDFFDQQLSILWEENSGNVAWRITRLAYKKVFAQPPKTIFREMLALCGAHTEEGLTADVLNHPEKLRLAIQNILAYQPHYQWHQAQIAAAAQRVTRAAPAQQAHFMIQKRAAEAALQQALDTQTVSAELNKFLPIYYQDFWQDSFLWLINTHDEAHALIEDIIDTLRTLRAANASRQRGTRLRASGGHQIFLDHYSGNAIYAINAEQKLFLLENPDNLLSGEVNLSSTEFTAAGDLRLSFYRGQFADSVATDRAVLNAAVAINHVQGEMIDSFIRLENSEDYKKKRQSTFILLENCDDNPLFTPAVVAQLIIFNPLLKERIKIVPSLQNAWAVERNRYIAAQEFTQNLADEQDLLTKIAGSGHKIEGMDIVAAFQYVKLAKLAIGESLIEAGSPASFVYVALELGLKGYPLGGYEPFLVKPFIPLGNVSVIRADMRNAHIVAEKAVTVLMIPREVYLRYWHTTYSEAEFISLIAEMGAETALAHDDTAR